MRSTADEKRAWSPNRPRSGFVRASVLYDHAEVVLPGDLNLPRRQKQLFDALLGKGDVSWQTLCDAIEAEPTVHLAQYLGPYITKLNRRLVKSSLKVEPGRMKGTYRLVAI